MHLSKSWWSYFSKILMVIFFSEKIFSDWIWFPRQLTVWQSRRDVHQKRQLPTWGWNWWWSESVWCWQHYFACAFIPFLNEWQWWFRWDWPWKNYFLNKFYFLNKIYFFSNKIYFFKQNLLTYWHQMGASTSCSCWSEKLIKIIKIILKWYHTIQYIQYYAMQYYTPNSNAIW